MRLFTRIVAIVFFIHTMLIAFIIQSVNMDNFLMLHTDYTPFAWTVYAVNALSAVLCMVLFDVTRKRKYINE